MANYRSCFVEHERGCTRLRDRKLFWDSEWFNDLVWLEAWHCWISGVCGHDTIPSHCC